MKMLYLPIVTTGLLLWGSVACLGQELPRQEVPPQEIPPPKPVPAPEVLPAPLPSDCPTGHPALKILEVEQSRPVQIIVPREVITAVTRPGFVIAYREEKQEIFDYVLKPQEITRLVPCTVTVPCQEIDPHTGQCCTVMKEITQLKPQKEFTFTSVPEKRVLIVKVPYLKEVEEVIPQRNILLEYQTVPQVDIAVLGVPTEVHPDRYLTTPPTCPAPGPSCPGPGCHK